MGKGSGARLPGFKLPCWVAVDYSFKILCVSFLPCKMGQLQLYLPHKGNTASKWVNIHKAYSTKTTTWQVLPKKRLSPITSTTPQIQALLSPLSRYQNRGYAICKNYTAVSVPIKYWRGGTQTSVNRKMGKYDKVIQCNTIQQWQQQTAATQKMAGPQKMAEWK